MSSPVLIRSLLDPWVPSTLIYFRFSKKHNFSPTAGPLHTRFPVCSSPPFLASVLKRPVPCCAKSFQLCLTLCDPMGCDQPGSSIHGIPREYWSGLPSLLQGLFPTQGSNWCLLGLTCSGKWVLYHWHHLGSPKNGDRGDSKGGQKNSPIPLYLWCLTQFYIVLLILVTLLPDFCVKFHQARDLVWLIPCHILTTYLIKKG